MTRLAPLLSLLAAGCLYTDTKNERPRLQLAVDSSLVRGQFADVKVAMSDDQNDAQYLGNELHFAVLDAQHQPADPCTATITNLVPQLGTAEVAIYRAGHYFISAQTSDVRGAVSEVEQPVDVIDAAPQFGPGAHLQATTPLDQCQSYTAGQAVVVGLDGTVGDPDGPSLANPSCDNGETVVYTWYVIAAPAGAQPRLGALSGGACPAGGGLGASLPATDPQAQICLYTDSVLAASGASDYQLVLGADDGVNSEVRSPALTVPVQADQPPCIVDGTPELGLRVVDRLATQQFTLLAVNDDLDPYPSSGLHFFWSVWRGSEQLWRTVDDYDQPSYSLDTSGFDVGEQVQVRVEAVDRTGTRASCDVDAPECQVASCAAPANQQCNRWMTWSLELR